MAPRPFKDNSIVLRKVGKRRQAKIFRGGRVVIAVHGLFASNGRSPVC
jgi:hypothetical protein